MKPKPVKTERPMRLAAALLPLALLLAACYAPGAPAPSAPALDGRTFLSVAVKENGVPRPLVQGTQIRLAFADGRMSASAGCNQLGGTYRVENGQLVVDALAQTDMGCDRARHDQDAWLAGLLEGRPAVRLAGHDLVLERGGTVVELLDRRVADPDQPLAGPTWRVETLIDGQVAASAPGGVVATLTFGSDGRVAIDTGCNTGHATYSVDGSRITLSPIALTKRGCPGPAGELEQGVLAVLQTNPIDFEIEAKSLTLSAGARGLGLRAR